MANTRIIFYGTDCNCYSTLTAMCTDQNEITLEIRDTYSKEGSTIKSIIMIDRATAIKLVKILRLEISKAEVKNG
jgi:hypothetical protein